MFTPVPDTWTLPATVKVELRTPAGTVFIFEGRVETLLELYGEGIRVAK